MSEYQWRVRCDKPMPEGWPWEDDFDQVNEEAEVMRGLGFTGVRIETRLRPIPGNRGDYEVTW